MTKEEELNEFNPGQREAITSDLKDNILISAGAGSGKTKTLSYKVYHLVEYEGIKPSQLLVLTFTDKAAFEMKERILKQFQMHESPYAEEMISAHIQTFDSFSSYLVRKYASLLEIPDNIQILDENILEAKRKEILDQVILEHYRSESDRVIKTFEKFCSSDVSFIKETILQIDDELNKLLPQKKKEFIENYDENYLSEESFKKALDKFTAVYKANLLIFLKACFFNMRTFGCEENTILKALNDEKNFDVNQYSSNELTSAIARDMFDCVYKSFSLESKDFFSYIINLSKDPNTKALFDKNVWRAMKKELSETLYQKEYTLFIKPIKDYIKDTFITKMDDFLSTDMNEQFNRNLAFKEDIHLLFELLLDMNRRLDDYKLQINSYTFADIEYKALSLLTDSKYESAAKEIKNRFKYVLVDEYQDTNDIQETFLNSISENATLFCVGDAKQSIYRFRNSNVQLFMNRKKEYEEDPSKGKVISMNWNYRSSFELLNAINLIFNRYMTEGHGGIFYEESQVKDGKTIYPQRLDHDPNFKRSKVENSFYGLGLIQFDNPCFKNDTLYEMNCIIMDIQDKIKNHYQIAENGKTRDCRYSDFAILMRSKAKFNDYQKCFEEHQIPLNIIMDDHLIQINAILLIQSLIRMLSSYIESEKKNIFNKENQRELFLSIARSYIYGKEEGYDDNKIYQILSKDNETFYNDKIMLKIKDFAHRHVSSTLSIIFLDMLSEFEILKKLPAVGDVVSNIDKIESFYQIIVQQENIGQGIEDFARLFKNISKYKIDISSETNIDVENAVQLMTIHKSKGLEFPIVYMPLHNNFMAAPRNTKLGVNISLEQGIILPTYKFDEKAANIRNMIYYTLEGSPQEEVNEHIRIIYVALTRAKDCLYIVGNENPKCMNKQTGDLYEMLQYIFYYPRLNLEYVDFALKKNLINQDFVNVYEMSVSKLKTICSIDKKQHSPDQITTLAKEDVYEELVNNDRISIECQISFIEDKLMEYFISESGKCSDDQKAVYIARTHYMDFESKDASSFLVNHPNSKTGYAQAFESEMEHISLALKKNDKKKEEKKKYDDTQFRALAYILEGFQNPLYIIHYDEDIIPSKSYSPNIKGEDSKDTISIKQNEFSCPDIDVNDSKIIFMKQISEKQRASKQILSDEELEAKIRVLDYGTRLHQYLELTDFETKDTSFIKDEKDKQIIDKVLSSPLFSNLENTKIYHEYSYYDEEFETTGSIDCLMIKEDEIDIIDYKTKNIDDEAYDDQLKVYRRNVEYLFPDKPIRMFLLSLLKGDIREVK